MAPNIKALIPRAALLLAIVTLLIILAGRREDGLRLAHLVSDSIESKVCLQENHSVVPKPNEEDNRLEGLEGQEELASPSDTLFDAHNATLGFSKIFVLSMPHRTDKRDGITLAAYHSGLEIEFVDGVDGKAMGDSEKPQGWLPEETPGALGCWRGHMNIIQRVVRERLESVLIMEDDVDWDVMIKSQMLEFARGTRYVHEITAPSRSPYGDKWDALFVGHCGINNWIDDGKYWVTENDPTVIPPRWRLGNRIPNQTPPSLSGDHTRLVFPFQKVTCTQAYGLSLRGATRVLHHQSLGPYGATIDQAYSRMCREPLSKKACVGPFPTLMGHHRLVGPLNKDSDRKQSGGNNYRTEAMTMNVVYPMRLNMEAYMIGHKHIKSQWPNETIEMIEPAKLRLPPGKAVFVNKDEFVLPQP